MANITVTLAQLQKVQSQKAERLRQQRQSKEQHRQRLENTLCTLNTMVSSLPEDNAGHAVLLFNQSAYRNNIQHLIEWQKQEASLAKLEVDSANKAFLHEAQREKCLALLLSAEQRTACIKKERLEQKNTDAISSQNWLRQHVQQ